MRKVLFILAVVSILAATACSDGAKPIKSAEKNDSDGTPAADTDTETAPDEDGTVSHDKDAEPAADDDTLPDHDNDGDTPPAGNDEDAAEHDDDEPLDDNDSCVGETRIVACTGLPEHAVWNTAGCVEQICGDEGFAPSNTGTHSEKPASSTVKVSEPKPTDLEEVPCPDGTAPKNGTCTECARIIPGIYITESDAGTALSDKNGKTAVEQCFTAINPETGGLTGKAKQCCGSGPLYRIKNEQQVELTQPYTYNGELLPNTVPGCAEGFVFAEDKCYECRWGELKLENEVFKCYREIGKECFFECDKNFSWNGSECMPEN